MNNPKCSYCIQCDAPVDKIDYKAELKTYEVKGTEITYVEVSAYCHECGMELYVPEINDMNKLSRDKAYAAAKRYKGYIDKDAALEFSRHLDHEHGNKHFIWGVETYAKYLQGLSSVNVEPEPDPVAEGRWIWDAHRDRYGCSRCGKPAPLFKDNYDRVYFYGSKFCPHCGAKMTRQEGGNNG